MSPAKRKPQIEAEVELRPDGWERFEAAIGAAVKSGPQHRTATARSAAKKKARPKRRLAQSKRS